MLKRREMLENGRKITLLFPPQKSPKISACCLIPQGYTAMGEQSLYSKEILLMKAQLKAVKTRFWRLKNED